MRTPLSRMHSPITLGVTPRSASRDPAIVDRMIEWLLSGDVQMRKGRHTGGVIGWIDSFQDTRFIYPEITGYYLIFLAYLRAFGFEESRVIPRIRSAVRWLERNWNSSAYPYTRLYLDGCNQRDWRNRFRFSFDLAMMLRGLVCVADCIDTRTFQSLRACLCAHLLDFVDTDGLLKACVAITDGPQPETWSVKSGPYQLKAAVPILELSGIVPSRLQTAAEEIVGLWRSFAPTTFSFKDLHPTLYFIEGLLLLGIHLQDSKLQQHAGSVLASIFDDRAVAKFFRKGVQHRSDVVAQSLRVACLLHEVAYVGGVTRLEKTLANSLISCCGDGAVYFHRDSQGHLLHANTWSTMFAVQALRLYQRLDDSFDPKMIRFLV